MSRAKSPKTKKHNNLKPHHRHTKEYLKHYYPFIPLFASIGFLILVLFSPFQKNNQAVLGAYSNITPQQLLSATNTQRQLTGENALTINPQLQNAAQNKAEDMVNRNYWSHKTPEGKDPWAFIVNENYQYQKAGENLAYGFNDSTSTIDGWMKSESHKRNLLDKDFTEVGFGIADSNNFNESGHSTVVVAMYADPLPPGSVSSTQSNQTHILGDSKSVLNANKYTRSTWGVYLVGAIMGVSVMYLAGAHGSSLRKKIKKGEKFIIKHPLLDSAVICLIALGVIMLRSAGQIL